MTHALQRRLDRLSSRLSPGRMIILNIADEHGDDADLINATLAAVGIEREDGDLVLLLKSYGTLDAQPPCTLLSVLPLAPNRRKVLR